MCGIAGIYLPTSQQQPDAEILRQMNDRQLHRGPDAGDYFFAPGIGLAHRRLSIIDIDGSPQPMRTPDQSICVVFNGEIYNFKELRAELQAKGYQFISQGDTETILHAWREWGVDCVHHLRGMFAIGIWDQKQQSLFLARDRLGVKPMFYALLPGNEFIFGSELKVLKQHPKFDRTLRHTAIEDYFTFGYVPEPFTIYQHCFKLEPGHRMLLTQGMTALPQPEQYWDIPTEWTADITAGEAEAELIQRFKEAVGIRMVADVPLGAFLSGGVDSSAVVAMMSQLQSGPVNTCAIGFDVPTFNETEFAQMVADRYQTNHQVKVVSQNDFALIDQLADLYDEPYADSSAMPTYRVCEMAREQVTVALSGDGGDEVFAGYRRYQMHLQETSLRNRLPLPLRQAIFTPLGKWYPKLAWAPKFLRAKTTFQALAMDDVQGYHNSISILRADDRDALFSDEFKQKLQGYNSLQVFRRYQEKTKALDPLKTVQYIDLKTYLVGDILTKVDRASMAHSLEVRVPFLDHRFIEWAFKLNSAANLAQGIGKLTLKKTLEPHLPEDVLYRKKMGFAVPLADWFRGPLKQKLQDDVLSERMLNSEIFNAQQLQKLVNEHLSGLKDNSSALWTLMMFDHFLRLE
jgi:asparagine synthase (glutamine-hydrolysing)